MTVQFAKGVVLAILQYSRNFFQADLTLVVTAESHPPSASSISPK